MTIELAHIPTYIKEAAGKLHRYCQSGETLAKSPAVGLLAVFTGRLLFGGRGLGRTSSHLL